MAQSRSFERWHPPVEPTRQEALLLKRLNRTKKLFRFLREHRHELFDDAFQEELEGMYRGTGAGLPPVPPAKMAMALLLQGYAGASDAEAVELTVVDLRWQLVLGTLGETQAAFSQGALHDFRHRLVSHDMDRRLLERTRELAASSGAFDPRKLPKKLRVAMDSSPLVGAGRVEDTFNLLGHAARNVVACIAGLLGRDFDDVCHEAGVPVLMASSIKAGLDCDWADPKQKDLALKTLMKQLTSLQGWTLQHLPQQAAQMPLQEALETLQQIIEQDIDPDPEGGGGPSIRRGTAPDRRVSVEDGEMRHGRKSKSKRFNGYKRHIAADLDTGLIVACHVSPANRPEEQAAVHLRDDILLAGLELDELHIDRGYISSPLVDELMARRRRVFCKPWRAHNTTGAEFTKAHFHLNVRDMTITCPAGQREEIRPGAVVEFDPENCDNCTLRARCTMAAPGKGRTISIADNEVLQQRLRKQAKTREGRKQLRQRVTVEHKLAHISQRQGNRARYNGSRLNLFDLRRAATLQNLEGSQRTLDRAGKRAA